MRRFAASARAPGLRAWPRPQAGTDSGTPGGGGATPPRLDPKFSLIRQSGSVTGEAAGTTSLTTRVAARLPDATVNVVGLSAPHTQNRMIRTRSRLCLTRRPRAPNRQGVINGGPQSAVRSLSATTNDIRAQAADKRPRRSPGAAPNGAPPAVPARGLSFGLIHPSSRRFTGVRGRLYGLVRTLADGGERWCAVLESV